MKNNLYFDRYAHPLRYIKSDIKPETFVSVVIPSYKETNISPTLQSLDNCIATKFPVEVIIVVNQAEQADMETQKANQKTISDIEYFLNQQKNQQIQFHVIDVKLPKKKAGVGLARKIGMDEAAFRQNSIDQNGVILCFDADSRCESNYLSVVETHFYNNPDLNAASIHFEHPININVEFDPIVYYELHLRYYIQALRFIGYPYAYHTIGSSMAVRSSVYQKEGGMNKRKAGEDFYFLHKLIPLGNFININDTKVIPSPRISDRVPFGTGRAMLDYQDQKKDLSLTYQLKSFYEIKSFLDTIQSQQGFQKIPKIILNWLTENGWLDELNSIKEKSKDKNHFNDRFWQWFNGFKMLKCVHYLRDHKYAEQDIIEASQQLLRESNLIDKPSNSARDLLKTLRELDKY